jgi:hypothetical protein
MPRIHSYGLRKRSDIAVAWAAQLPKTHVALVSGPCDRWPGLTSTYPCIRTYIQLPPVGWWDTETSVPLAQVACAFAGAYARLQRHAIALRQWTLLPQSVSLIRCEDVIFGVVVVVVVGCYAIPGRTQLRGCCVTESPAPSRSSFSLRNALFLG